MLQAPVTAPAIVGLAFVAKKLPRVLTSDLRALAADAGLQLVVLDPHAPLEQQGLGPGPQAPDEGPASRVAAFDLVLHKLHADSVWEAHLSDYVSLHPHVRLLDPPAAIHRTEDRSIMLAAIPPDGLQLQLSVHPTVQSSEARSRQQLATPSSPAATSAAVRTVGPPDVEVRAPTQVLVRSREEILALAGGSAGLQPPLIIKTQCSFGAGGSGHGLAVVLDWAELEAKAEAMQRAAASAPATSETVTGGSDDRDGGAEDGAVAGGSWVPLIAQQYIPHSEALYKVYVLGQHVRVERRASLTVQHLAGVQEREAQQQQTQLQEGGRGDAQPHRPARATAGGGLMQHLSAQPQAAVSTSGAATALKTAHPAVDNQAATAAAWPPVRTTSAAVLDERVLGAVAQALSQRMGLTMFNFDVVVPEAPVTSAAAAPAVHPDGDIRRTGQQPGHSAVELLYVVDVNYFPGYDKLAGWEALLVEHLRAEADGVAALRAAAEADVMG